MAFLMPAIRDENSHIHIGKDVDALKATPPVPTKAGHRDRKALKDLVNPGKPLTSGPSKALKDLTNTDKHQVSGPSKALTLKEKNLPAKAGRQDRKALKDLSNTGKPLISGPSNSKVSTLKEKNVPAKAGGQGRKALKDLSNTGKPLTSDPLKTLKDHTNAGKHQVSGPSKASTLKEKNVLHGRETINNFVKSNFLTDEQLKKCFEWAEEGIERAHITRNDLEKETGQERIHRSILESMSYLDELLSPSYELRMPVEEPYEDSTDLEVELEIEELPLLAKSQTSGDKEIDDLLESEDHLWFLEKAFELELELTEDGDVDCVGARGAQKCKGCACRFYKAGHAIWRCSEMQRVLRLQVLQGWPFYLAALRNAKGALAGFKAGPAIWQSVRDFYLNTSVNLNVTSRRLQPYSSPMRSNNLSLLIQPSPILYTTIHK